MVMNDGALEIVGVINLLLYYRQGCSLGYVSPENCKEGVAKISRFDIPQLDRVKMQPECHYTEL